MGKRSATKDLPWRIVEPTSCLPAMHLFILLVTCVTLSHLSEWSFDPQPRPPNR